MSSLPTLFLDDEAEIEREREKLLETRDTTYSLVFQSPLNAVASRVSKLSSGEQPRPLRSILRLELRNYGLALFDLEAKVYIRQIGTMDEVRSWVGLIASRIQAEVINETKSRAETHDFHCSFEERVAAVEEAFEERIDYWLQRAEKSLARVPATTSKLRATVTRAEDTLKGGADDPSVPMPSVPDSSVTDQKAKKDETIGEQIEKLRLECDLSIEELAAKVGIDPTNVSRHIRGLSTPNFDSRRQYKACFSKLLNRQVVIRYHAAKRSRTQLNADRPN